MICPESSSSQRLTPFYEPKIAAVFQWVANPLINRKVVPWPSIRLSVASRAPGAVGTAIAFRSLPVSLRIAAVVAVFLAMGYVDGGAAGGAGWAPWLFMAAGVPLSAVSAQRM